MNICSKIIIFVLGVAVGIGVYRLHLVDEAAGKAKADWLVCTMAHENALHERAEQYRMKLGRWPANIQELVQAHFLPEFSEVRFFAPRRFNH